MRGALLGILLAITLLSPATAALQPHEVVVVVNNHPDVAAMSRAIGNYYCARRGIPLANIAEVTVDPAEIMYDPLLLTDDILADTENPPSLVHLLKQRPGFDINDPGSDPTKCIVLCWGVPIKIGGNEVLGSVDSTLTLLFNQNPWGRQPIGDFVGGGNIANPFHYTSESAAFDFGEFRGTTANASVQTAPSFSIVRMLAQDRAIAGGRKGLLYTGSKSGDT